MKKILSLLVICVFIICNFNINAFADNGNFDLNNKTYFELQLSKNNNWKKFLKLIDKFIKVNWKNKNKLLEINEKINKLDINNIKNNETLNKIMYLSSVINIALKDLKNDNITNDSVYDKLYITIYEDKRCTNCPTDDIIDQLKQLPSISSATIVRKDFSENWVSDYLKNNKVNALPLFVFSTNNFDISKDPDQKDQYGQSIPKINSYLYPLPDGDYFIQIGAIFDPFKERSERWFLILDKSKLKEIKDNSYVKWNKNAKITWIEYSDLECPYCAKLHNDGTENDLFKKYWEKLNKIYNHFPLAFHQNAKPWALILECLWEQKWGQIFYNLIDKSFTEKNSDKNFLIDEAVKLWANKETLEKCVDDEKYLDKVNDEQKVWTEIFSIMWTPWNVIINNETWEYEIISWAYPTEYFIEVIDKLLK